MIDKNTKAAFEWLEVIGNAFIEAEWQRRKAEFQLEHDGCQDGPAYDSDGAPCKCEDERHNRTDADWRAEVIEELKS